MTTDQSRRHALSFGQERLFFLELLAAGSSLYHETCVLRLTGPLHAWALAAAMSGVVERHEVLRGRIETVAGRPVQVIGPAPRLEVLDLAGEPEARAREIITDGARRPFQLSREAPFRPLLVRLGHEEHILAITVHHMVIDAWSFSVLFTELWTLYDAATAGLPPSLPELAVQYADHAAAQRLWLDDPRRREAELDFWCREIGDAPIALELPLDHARPVTASYRGASLPFRVDATLTRKLRQLARQQRATPFAVFLASFAVLLARWSGEPDLLIGVPAVGRNGRELEAVIGFFVNTIVVRVDGTDDPPFTELLRGVRQTLLRALSHQDLPFEILVDRLSPERDPGRNPLVQVMFQVDNTPPSSSAPPEGLQMEVLDWKDEETSHFDLSVHLADDGEVLAGTLTYATDLFDRATIERLAGLYLRVLDRVSTDPTVRLSAMALTDRP